MWTYNHSSNDELRHYGVLGIKRGVRRGRVSSAYGEASKKLNKMTTKIETAQRKANKQMYKADKKRYSPFSSEKSVRKARVKAGKAQNKVNRKVYKAKKWIDNMSKTFGKTSQAMSKEQLALGKKYAQQLTRNAEMNDFMFKLREG